MIHLLMVLICSILFFGYIFWLYKKSESDYFLSENVLKNWSILIEPLLYNFGFEKERIKQILEAYLYFVSNPKEFDGATIVSDIWQIRGLDISAMNHDYSYILSWSFSFWKGLIFRLKADWQYSQDMRQFKVNWLTAYGRMALCIFINITFLYNLIKLIQKININLKTKTK